MAVVEEHYTQVKKQGDLVIWRLHMLWVHDMRAIMLDCDGKSHVHQIHGVVRWFRALTTQLRDPLISYIHFEKSRAELLRGIKGIEGALKKAGKFEHYMADEVGKKTALWSEHTEHANPLAFIPMMRMGRKMRLQAKRALHVTENGLTTLPVTPEKKEEETAKKERIRAELRAGSPDVYVIRETNPDVVDYAAKAREAREA